MQNFIAVSVEPKCFRGKQRPFLPILTSHSSAGGCVDDSTEGAIDRRVYDHRAHVMSRQVKTEVGTPWLCRLISFSILFLFVISILPKHKTASSFRHYLAVSFFSPLLSLSTTVRLGFRVSVLPIQATTRNRSEHFQSVSAQNHHEWW